MAIDLTKLPEETLNDFKKYKILILGPYKNYAIKFLEKCRDKLRNFGFNDTYLVSDNCLYEKSKYDRNEKNYRNSLYQIDNSDLLIFILLPHKDLSGVSIELQHAIEKKYYNKVIIFMPEEDNGISSMIKGSTSYAKLYVHFFKLRSEILDSIVNVSIAAL